MLDIEIIRFYNNVKDPSWPDIFSYADYHHLPNFIKEECDKLHHFQHRKEQICDVNTWIDVSHPPVCVYEDLAYVPVQKCAYTYYTTFFTNLGWKRASLDTLDIKNTKFFGLVMNPLQRRLKGITQWIVDCYQSNEIIESSVNPWKYENPVIDWVQLQSDIKTKYFNKLLSTVTVGDMHSWPYVTMFGNLLDKINWIPMDSLTDDEVKTSIMSFCRLHGHNIQLPMDDARLHVSSENKLQVFEIVKKAFYSDPINLYQFYKIYNTDLKFYYNLVDNFSPDWQHL
jgi:hypothetical protein